MSRSCGSLGLFGLFGFSGCRLFVGAAAVLAGAPLLLPGFMCRRCLLAGTTCFPLRFFQTLACALQFFFRDAYALFCYIRLQSRALHGFRWGGFALYCFVGCNFAACLLHPRACEVSEGAQVSHKRDAVSTAAAESGGAPSRPAERLLSSAAMLTIRQV